MWQREGFEDGSSPAAAQEMVQNRGGLEPSVLQQL